MKKMKRISCMMLAAVMVLAASVTSLGKKETHAAQPAYLIGGPICSFKYTDKLFLGIYHIEGVTVENFCTVYRDTSSRYICRTDDGASPKISHKKGRPEKTISMTTSVSTNKQTSQNYSNDIGGTLSGEGFSLTIKKTNSLTSIKSKTFGVSSTYSYKVLSDDPTGAYVICPIQYHTKYVVVTSHKDKNGRLVFEPDRFAYIPNGTITLCLAYNAHPEVDDWTNWVKWD